MRKSLSFLFIFALAVSILPVSISVAAADPAAIRVAPPAPKYSDTERHAELARRRSAVAAKMANDSMMILFSADPKLYTNDVDYVYRQENNLYYLTNLRQDGATLVITKTGGTVKETIFLPKRVPVREAWEGKMYSREQAISISGIKDVLNATPRIAYLDAMKALAESSAQTVYLLQPRSVQDQDGEREFASSVQFAKQLRGVRLENARSIFDDLRHIKSPYELKMLQHAIDITTEAQMRSMGMVGKAKMEYEVQAEVEYTFRRRNADFWGYPSIVGCGPNATTLHYVESQGEIRSGDLLLMDVGAEYEHYTADVTRTFPVNGKFSKEQADIYRIVYDAQEAVAAATKPGVTFQALQTIAQKTINDGLFNLGLVTDKNGGQVGVWFIHGLGHWLGMNVHDVGRYGVPLAPGMVYTNEPGIYIREDALDNLPDNAQNREFIAKVRPVFEKYKNIGVRIEDDMLVTATGVEWMTKDLPRKLEDIERFMSQASREMAYVAPKVNDRGPTALIFSLGSYSFDNVMSGVTMRRRIVRSGRDIMSSLSDHDHRSGE